MPLKVALQMDPIGSVNINADSTFRIALEAQARGHQLFFYTPDRLAFVEGRVVARGWPYEWLARGAAADDPQTARALAEQAGWQVDAVNLAADVVFWGLLGLLLAALVNKVRFRT